MKSYNIFASLLMIFLASRCTQGQIITERIITAIWGENATLPCRFEHEQGDVIAVYWHRHERTGAPDSETRIVVQNFRGVVLNRDAPRYSITADYSMVITNISVEDETTFSCEIALENGYDGRNYTDIRVLAMAYVPHPLVTDCSEVKEGRCEYRVGEVNGETFQLVCQVTSVRPAVNLTWIANTGAPLYTTNINIQESVRHEGLYDVYLTALVSKAKIGQELVCIATGEAVYNSSQISVHIVQHSPIKDTGGLSGGEIVGIVLACICPILVVYLVYKKYYRSDDTANDQELTPLNDGKVQLTQLQDEIKAYSPGTWTKVLLKEGRQIPSGPIRLAVYGDTGVGKSSLIRSFIYAVNGEYTNDIDIASGEEAAGAVTVDHDIYKITDNIVIEDNKGLHDLRAENVPHIIENIRQESIYGPVFVFWHSSARPIDRLKDIIPAYFDKIVKEFGARSFLILTHGNDIDRQDAIRGRLITMGAFRDRIAFIENFTRKPNEPYDGQVDDHKMELLELLKEIVTVADKNLVHQLNKKDVVVQAEEAKSNEAFVEFEQIDDKKKIGILRGFFSR